MIIKPLLTFVEVNTYCGKCGNKWTFRAPHIFGREVKWDELTEFVEKEPCHSKDCTS